MTTPLAAPAARVYTNMRTADLERFRRMTPARVLYAHTRYAFDDSLVDPDNPPVRRSGWGIVRELLGGDYGVVEVNEPAMGENLPFLLAQLAAIRLRGMLTRRRATVASYCIQNTDPALAVGARWHLPGPVARLVTEAGVKVAVRGMDRLAFGTAAALALYERYVGRERLRDRSRLIEELPSPCDCLSEADAPAPTEESGSAEESATTEAVASTESETPTGRVLAEARIPTQLVFVGMFSVRKGIRQAMAAWDVVRQRRPEATFHVIGTGPLEAEVAAWTADRPEVTLEIDPPRPTIHRVLRQSGVLILLSQPAATWREQIGFPITEGLSHGCEIVTTSETGLAQWLAQHDHGVVPPDAPPDRVADEIAAAFARAPGRLGSLPALPAVDQRIAADHWMFTGDNAAQG